LRPDARSRINSAYMVCYFIGGAVGSVTAGVVYSARGWSGVCLLGALFGLLTCALTLYERVRPPVPAGAIGAVHAAGGAGATGVSAEPS
jgi:predicted MFS family arabinose efflux permease